MVWYMYAIELKIRYFQKDLNCAYKIQYADELKSFHTCENLSSKFGDALGLQPRSFCHNTSHESRESALSSASRTPDV